MRSCARTLHALGQAQHSLQLTEHALYSTSMTSD